MASFLRRIANAGAALRGNPLDNPAVPLSAAGWLQSLWGGAPTSSGVAVNEKTAMQLTTWYACVNVLASDFSSLPCKVYRQGKKGNEPAEDHGLYELLAVEPNENMSAVAFWGALMASAASRGNAYAFIQRDKETVVGLWPIHPNHVTPKRKPNGDLEYIVSVGGVPKSYSSSEIFHVPGLSMDGVVGMDPIQVAQQSVGIGIAAQRHIGGFFGRGSRPSGILKRVLAPSSGGTLGAQKPESTDALRDSWERGNAGENQGRTAVLPIGYDWVPVEITPEQGQFLQILQYTRTDIAGLFRVPPHMVGDTSRLSNSNHESSALEYVTFTLRPWIMRFEAEIQRKLLPKIGPNANKLSVRFDFTEMVRGDFASRMTAYAVLKQWGVYNTDRILEDMGENPIGGPAGTKYWAPLNMIDAAKVGEEPEPAEPGDGNEPPEPKGNGGRNQRMLMARLTLAFSGLYRDAAGRLMTRDKRDAAAVQATFGAVLQAIGEEAVREAHDMFHLAEGVDLGTERFLREAAKAIEKRSSVWTPESLDAETPTDLLRTVRSIVLNIFREAGAHLAEAA